MSQTVNDPTLWFRMHIGALDVANPPTPGPGAVVVRWPAMAELLGLDAGWNVTEDFVFTPNGYGVARRYAAAKGSETITVEIFNAARGFPGAVDRLVQIATTTMMPMPPYDKAPDASRLGEVAVISTDPSQRTLIWTFRGLCLTVETSSGGEATLAAARRLQAFVARHVVDDAAAAKVRPRLSLPTGELSVSTGATVDVIPSKGTSGLTITAYPDNQAVAVVVQTPDRLAFQGRSPGRTMFSVVLADPVTLLCDAGNVAIVSR